MTLPAEDIAALEKLKESLMGRADPLAKAIAQILLEKGITTIPELAKKLGAIEEIDEAPPENTSKEMYVDAKGKRWSK